MKNQYMVEIDLINISTIQTIDLNTQNQQIEYLLNQGTIRSFAQSLDHQKIWLTLQYDSEFEVLALLQTFHLSDFMIPSILTLSFNKNHQTFSSAVLN